MVELSVIIPTRNRAQYLSRALDSVTKQTLDSSLYEVLVVDNGSSDNTKIVVDGFAGRIINLRYFYEPEPGLHVGRHAGMKNAQSSILVYADDDIEAFPTWLEGIWESMQDEDVVLVGGKDMPKYEINPPFWVLEKWYELCDYGHCVPFLSLIDFGDEVMRIPPGYVYGCNFAVRKWILEKSKGFHPDGMPWEMIEYRGDGETYVSAFISRNNMKAIYNPKASVWHLVPASRMTVDYFKKWGFSMGVSSSYSEIRNQRIEILSSSAIPLKKRIRHAVRHIIGERMTFFLTRCLQRKKNKEQKQLPEIDCTINRSFEIGKEYHRMRYKMDPKLREWVHKEAYL